MFKHVLVLTLVAVVGWANPASACDDDDADGLDIGLVLSGGGALSSTQVGAIQALDELGIPIHCVAGTSFGAVVGGFYASGYTGDEIAEIFQTTNWNDIIVTGAARGSQTYLQKEQEGEYFSGHFAGLDENGLRLPSGLASMQELRRFFRETLSHIEIGTDFDQIGLPYRAVATNLSDGTAKAFDDGDIVEAMLASMAVPGIYAPRIVDGGTYVDGGMAANLPVQIAKDMGADIIIAIDTTIAPGEVFGRVDVGVVSQQLLNIVVYRQYETQIAHLKDPDLLIKPELDGLTVAGFQNVELGFESGRSAMNSHRAELSEIKRLAAPSERVFLRRERRENGREELIIVNDTLISDERIKSRYQASAPKPSSIRFRDLAAFGGFDEVDLAKTRDGARLQVSERDLGQTVLQAGMRSSNNFSGDSKFSLLARISKRPFSVDGGEIDAAFEFGSDFGAQVRVTHPLGESGKYFVQPQVFYRGEEILFDIGDVRIGEFWQQRVGARVRVGRELGNWGVVGFESGALYGQLDSQITLIEDFETLEYGQVGVGGFFAVDTLDRLDWPNSGLKFRASAERFFDINENNQETDKYTLSGLYAGDVGPVGVVLNGRVQAVENEKNQPVEILRLGGFRRLSAYPENALPTNRYAYGSVEVFRRLTRSDTVFSLPVYAGFIGEYTKADFDILEAGASQNFSSAGFYLGADTPFGPLFLGGALGREDAASVFVYLGRSF